MAKRDVLKDLKAKHGELDKVIPVLVNAGGQNHAANELQTTQSTISRWLKINGYKQRVIWEKEFEHETETA